MESKTRRLDGFEVLGGVARSGMVERLGSRHLQACASGAHALLVMGLTTCAVHGCGAGMAGPAPPAQLEQGMDSGTTSAGPDASIANLDSGGGGVGAESGGGAGAESGGSRASDAAGGEGSPSAEGGASIDSAAGADAASVVPGGVRWIGRVDASNPRSVKFAWSGTGFIGTVGGTKISVQLQTEGATTSAFFQPVIDGVAGARFQVMTGAAQTVLLANGLSAGDHTVELYRESEGMYGDSVFSGFVDGTVKGAPPPAPRFIEIIGDSISAGYGNLGVEVHPPWDNACTFSLDTESAYLAYGSILGRSLNAEVSIIARSGWGMYRDLSGNTSGVLSSVYENTLGTQSTATKWDFKRQADAVVINLGTNDAGPGDPGTPYEDAYVAFLHTIRGHYPNAWIFLTMGPMTSDPLLTQFRMHIDNVVTKMGDARVTAVTLATQDATMTGCDYHPNVAEDGVMAGVLTTALKAKLGW
jgi:lysophospholipase L1-like esterase